MLINIKSRKLGTQFQQSLLNNLQPLTPETAEDVEDMQALEFMTIHGAFASGNIERLGSFFPDLVFVCY